MRARPLIWTGVAFVVVALKQFHSSYILTGLIWGKFGVAISAKPVHATTLLG